MAEAYSASQDEADDIAATIAAAMGRMGVSGIPRNYEIFYEVQTGSNRALREAFAAVGERPSQEALDGLAAEHLPERNRDVIAEVVQNEIALRAHEILALLGREQTSLEKFGVILDQTSGRLQSPAALSRDLLSKVVGIMAAATDTTLRQSRQISRAMEQKSDELEKMRARLDQYKRLADTDPLTGVWNRRAFDKRLMQVFDNPRSVMFNALILADIDDFKSFNDRHGHPVGDRVLQSVAQILQARSDADCFVARTGGEEFALIVEGVSEEAAMQAAEAARKAIEQAEFTIGPNGHKYGPISISIGVCMAAEAGDAEDLYVKADRALYSSKVTGRNRVTLYSKRPGDRPSKGWLIYRPD